MEGVISPGNRKKDYSQGIIFLMLHMSPSLLPWVIEPEVFCGNPGVLSLCHRMDAIMQTNVSGELWGSIYPLSNYINRSRIVTNGSWRRRKRRGEWTYDEELERPGMHDCIFPSYFTRSLPSLRSEIPPNIRSHTDPLSLFPAWNAPMSSFFCTIMHPGTSVGSSGCSVHQISTNFSSSILV